MKKKRFNLFLNIAVLCMCVAAIAIGVYSAKNASLAVSGTVGFNAHDCDVDIDAILYGDSVNANQSNAQETDYGFVRSKEFAKTFSQIKIRKNDAGVSTGALNLDKFYFCDMTDDDSINPITIELKFTNKSKFRIRAKLAEKISTGNENIIATPDVGDLGSAILLEPEESENIKITLYMISSQSLENIGLEAKFSIYKEKGELEYGYIDQNTGDLATSDTLAENKIPAVIGIGSYDKTEEVLIVPSKGHITNADGTQEEVEAKAIGGRALTFPLFDENGELVFDETTQLPKTDEKNGLKSKSVLIKEGFKTMFGDSISFNSTIEHIKLPNSLIKILENSFELCTKLKEIVIDDNVEYLGANAFAGCISLETVVLPAINTIYDDVFYMCNKVEIYVKATEIPSWDDTTGTGWGNGWNLIADGTYAPTYLYSENSPAKDGNFWHYVDEKITIWQKSYSITYELNGGVNDPRNKTTLAKGESMALYAPTKANATFVGWVLNGEIVTEIKAGTIDNIILAAAWESGETIFTFEPTSDKTGASLSNITSTESVVVIPSTATVQVDGTETTLPVTQVGTTVSESVKCLIVPSSVIEFYGVFDTNNVEYIKLSEGLKTIGGLTGCDKLKEITLPKTVENVAGAGSTIFNSNTMVFVSVGAGVLAEEGTYSARSLGEIGYWQGLKEPRVFYYSETPIGQGWHYVNGKKEIWSIEQDGIIFTMPDVYQNNNYVNIIGLSKNFVGTELTIPESITYNSEIYSVNFVSNIVSDEITKLTYNQDGLGNSYMGYNLGLWFKNLQGIVLTGKEATNELFNNHLLPYLTDNDLTITFTEKIEKMGGGFFEKVPNLIKINLSATTTTYKSYNNGSVIMDSNNNVIVGTKNAVIPETAISIGDYAFYNRSGLISIYIPDSVTSIGSNVFTGCPALQNIVGNLIYIKTTTNDYYYLLGTTTSSLTSATINDNCKIIGYSAFNSCSSLTTITIPNGVKSIGKYAFQWCSQLISVIIPNSITTIGESAFSYCEALKTIVIPEGVTKINKDTFYYCKALTSITIPESVISIESGAFYKCWGIMNVVNKITYIKTTTNDYFCLYEVDSSLQYATINDDCKIIASYAFPVSSKLTSVNIPEGLTIISANAFKNCTKLTIQIGSGWVKVSDGSKVNETALLSSISYDVKRSTNA